MTPHEQHILGVVTAAADDIVAGLDRQRIPTTTAFAISLQVALSYLDRLDANTRTEVAARVIARLTHTQHLDA